jgi:hypothetical protein
MSVPTSLRKSIGLIAIFTLGLITAPSATAAEAASAFTPSPYGSKQASAPRPSGSYPQVDLSSGKRMPDGYDMPALGDYGNPSGKQVRFITAFEDADKKNPPPEGAIVCIGSSSMRMWNRIHKDLAPLTLIHRGFGGSTMYGALYYADRIVINYKPRAVLLYEGDTDSEKVTAERVAETFHEFVTRIHKSLPECRIYVISTKPSTRRWKLWPKMSKANQLMADECAKNERLTYIDIGTPMLKEDGSGLKDGILHSDNMHMTLAGYKIWTDTIRPILIAGELQYEKDIVPKGPDAP